jgi:general secretion pathway protein I
MQRNKYNGFTLIEVLVALAIVAIALVAVIKTTSQSVRNTVHLKNKMAAHWVAMNVLARMQVGLLPLSEHSKLTGEEAMLGVDWHWQVDLLQSDASYLRVEIKVFPKNSEQLVENLLGFVLKKDG